MAAGTITEDIHVGDVGTLFDITIIDQNSNPIDLSTASVLQFIFQKPTGDIITANGIFATDGTDGKVRYSTTDGLLDQSGNWKYQVYFEIGGEKKHTDISKFKVLANLL